MEENFDYIIVGAGMAGATLASRLHAYDSQAKILLLEKETDLGGRLRSLHEKSSDEKTNIDTAENKRLGIVMHGYGLNAVSDDLARFFVEHTSVDSESLESLSSQKRLGVIAAARVQELEFSEATTAKGFRAIGGAAAARDWKNLAMIWEGEDSENAHQDKNFLAFWKGHPKKSPAAVVLQHYARVFGIADMWSASLKALRQRAEYHTSGLRLGDWQALLSRLPLSGEESNLKILLNCQVGKADKNESGDWLLSTEKGGFTCKSLIVAQSPWQALNWLPKLYWPREVLALTTKTTPVSVVVLSAHVTSGDFDDLLDVHMIPAEEVQIIKSGGRELCFQATINYENSLQSANVVKAVRRLKRSRKKFLEAYPEYSLEGEHIALVPVGWSQSPQFDDQRHLSGFDLSESNTSALLFCGDAYGQSYNGDENLMQSLGSAYNTLTSHAGQAT